MRTTLIVCLLWLIHDAGLAAGTTLYVKKSGNDTADCTALAPCKTIAHAVSVASPGDTIQVGPGTYFELDGVDLDKDLTIDGGGFLGTRIGANSFTSFPDVFSVAPGAKVTLRRMTVTEAPGMGITNQGNLTLESVWIRENHGGGIRNSGDGILIMHNVGIDKNHGSDGLTNLGTALISDSRIVGTDPGSGVHNAGILIMARGLIAGNAGAGLVQSICPAITLLQSVTVSGNSELGVRTTCGEMRLRHVTIAANTSQTGAGGLLINFATVMLENTILATNEGAQCLTLQAATNLTVSHSLVGDFSCPIFPSPDNIVGVDPMLKGLAPRAGETVFNKLFHISANRAHALKAGSPAIDAGDNGLCSDLFGDGFLTDQFGVPRPIDGDDDGVARCDMGAIEYQKSLVRSDR